MPELSNVPVSELLAEVLRRPDEMFTGTRFLENEAFAVADHTSTRVCVDGAPIRETSGNGPELMAIRRNTGPYAGKLCLVGGGVGQVQVDGRWVPESFEEALRRHFMTDLGFGIEPVLGWDQPQYLAQDMRPIEGEVREGFTPNPASRHVIAARFLVRITDGEDAPTFGSTEKGGQEASGIEWFTEEDMPDPSDFGYGHDQTYRAMFSIAQRI